MKTALLASAASLLVLGFSPGLAAASTCPDSGRLPVANGDHGTATAVVCLVNQERAKVHLRPLKVNSSLTTAAAKYSARMVAEGFYSHYDPRGQSADQRVRASGYLTGAWVWGLGENIAAGAGSSATPETIVGTWLSSPSHRANMLAADWTEIGVGAAVGNPYTSRGATYTAEFGNRVAKPKKKHKPRPHRKRR
ncbi:MAG: CAP domain-containing protein [Actinomycetes bacterium]